MLSLFEVLPPFCRGVVLSQQLFPALALSQAWLEAVGLCPWSPRWASLPKGRFAGSQCEEARQWQGHEEGSWHTQGVLRLQGPLWKFLSMYPNKNLPAFVLCFSTLLTFSGKSQFRALVFCIWKSVSIQKPLWWLSSLPAGLQLRLWLFEASWLQEAQEA